MILSIIIPVYKIEAYIAQCLDSLICNNSDYEIICIDDGSPDLSGKICDDYASKYPFIKVIHKPNGGVSSARNEGIKLAKGKFIYFVDGDDYVIGIDYLINTLHANQTSKGFVTNCAILNINDEIKEKYEYLASYISINKEYAKYKRTFHASWSFVYRKSIIDNNNIQFDSQLKYAEDWIFVVHYLTCIGELQIINGFMYCYRSKRIGSATNSKYSEDNIWEHIRAYDRICQINPSANQDYYCKERKKLFSYVLSIVKHNTKISNNLPNMQKAIRNRIKQNLLYTTDFKFILKSICAFIDIRI